MYKHLQKWEGLMRPQVTESCLDIEEYAQQYIEQTCKFQM